MTDRIRTPASLPAIAAAFLLLSASSAWAQAPVQTTGQTKAEPKPRHVDVEAGVGVHFGLENDTPIDDDVYAVLGLAAPVSDHFDAEFQAAYFSGSENSRTIDPLSNPDDSLDGWHFNAGFRFYPGTEPDSTARFYLAAGTSLLLDYRQGEETAAVNLGPGVRMRAGDHSGMLLRVPVLIMLEDEPDPIMIPTFNLFYTF